MKIQFTLNSIIAIEKTFQKKCSKERQDNKRMSCLLWPLAKSRQMIILFFFQKRCQLIGRFESSGRSRMKNTILSLRSQI